jgi:DNA polymerase-3 subunit gamma/tau
MTGATAPRLQLELICARVLLPGASGESGYAARLDRLERRLEMTGAATSISVPPAASGRPIVRAPHQAPPKASPAPVGRPEPVSEVIEKPQRPRPVVPQPLPPDQSRTQSHPVESRPVESRPVEPRRSVSVPGSIDTDAIRRSWPDVLAKIATISRVTWSFVSQNTKVLDYNGERLLLGLSTDGLLSALRARNHAEVVRQALIEVIGVDAKVEGVLATDASSVDPAPVDPASVDPASVDPASVDAASADAASVKPPPAAKAAQPGVPSDPEPNDDWNTPSPRPVSDTAPAQSPASARPAGRAPAPAPDPTTAAVTTPTPGQPLGLAPTPDQPAGAASTPGQPVGPAPTPDRLSTPRQRARAAVAQEASRRNTSSPSSVADDSVVSADDEDIEEAGAIGQPVIERVLGGIVIGELDQ